MTIATPIWMNRKHEDFDIVMEFLCTLPPTEKHGASFQLLAQDLVGQDGTEKDIQELILESRQRGFLVDTIKDQKVFICEFDWVKVRNACNKYWKRVYA